MFVLVKAMSVILKLPRMLICMISALLIARVSLEFDPSEGIFAAGNSEKHWTLKFEGRAQSTVATVEPEVEGRY